MIWYILIGWLFVAVLLVIGNHLLHRAGGGFEVKDDG